MFADHDLKIRGENNPPHQSGPFRELNGTSDFEQLRYMDQQTDLPNQLERMSQQEIEQMNALLDQCQLLDNGQIIFGCGGGGFSSGCSNSLPATENPQHYQVDQQPPQHISQQEQQAQQKQYLQRLYLQQLQLHNEEQKKFDAAEAARQQQAQTSSSHKQLQQPFRHELPSYLDAAPSFAGPNFAVQQLPREIRQQGAEGTQINCTPRYDLQHPQQSQQPPPLPQRTPPVTWTNPVHGETNRSAAPVTSIQNRNLAAEQQPAQPGRGRRPSRGRSHARMASASARREQALQHLHAAAPLTSTSASTTASASVDANVANGSILTSCTSASADEELLRLQNLSIMHRSTDGISAGSDSSLSISSSTTTLSPKKQRTTSSSPKKPGRLESIYATLRNKASNMRRSRTAFIHETTPSNMAPSSTVAPLATLHDATFPLENKYSNIRSHHIHSRSSNFGNLDLDLALDLDLNLDLCLDLNAKSAAMSSFPPTPPMTGIASSLSSTSSSFSMSACSSVASSVADSYPFHQPLAPQVAHNPLCSHTLHHQHPNSSEEDLPQIDMASFVSGTVDDPFADTTSYFGGSNGTSGHQHQHDQPLPSHSESQYPIQPLNDNGVSSACWPTTLNTPNGKTRLQLEEDNDLTPVTMALNIPGRAEFANVSPSAYLANAAANLSGSSVIASASASAAMAAASNAMKHGALGNSAMEIDENWWQDCVVDTAVGEPLHANNASLDPVYGIAGNLSSGYPYECIATNNHSLGTNSSPRYCISDLASQGLMINMPPGAATPSVTYPKNLYYFPDIAAKSGGTCYPPVPPVPLAGEYEFRHDRASATSRRPKPRAPSAGARYHSTSRGDGLHSPRKRSSVTSLSKTNSSSGSAGYVSGEGSSCISAAAMTAPSTPRGHHQLGRRSHSMQNLSRTSPTPGGSGSMNTLSNVATTPSKGAIKKRRSASSLRRVSSTQGITSLTAVAAITAAVGAAGMPEPKTPSRRRSTSADSSRPWSAAPNGGIVFASDDNFFVNFTAEDHHKLMSGVAPSGSSKTKARRERALQEKTRQLSERLVRAMQEAGGDVAKLEADSFKDLTIAL
ncbi:hypothetical protein SEPCBS57363_001528 [Sporothrix epigloea]|uniref:Developmental regulatory protein wetA n=1 Tax=Sporothrix epigloea TaxID=1892477 RepID=A0ABP0DCC4_9PEZI